MAGQAGSEAFAVIALLVVSLLVLLLLRHYLPLRSTPSFLLTPIFLSLALPVSIILLVPIDFASSLREEDEATKGIWLPQRVMLVAWRISYWLTFCLTWFILPLLGEYVDSGYRTPRDRIIYSLKNNIRFYLIVLACIILGLVYVIIQNGFDGASLRSLAMALAYMIGLVQAIYLMGHGLVAIPRQLFRNANPSGRLRRLQSQAPKLHEKMEDSITELSELDQQVTSLQARKNGVSRDHEEWIEDLVDLSPPAYNRLSSAPPAPPSTTPRLPAVITDRYLADLTRRLARARHKRIRFISEWTHHVQSAASTQSILDSRTSQRLSFSPTPTPTPLSRPLLTPHLRYLLHTQLLPALRLFLGALLTLASFAIIWSEITKTLAPRLSIVSLTIIPHPSTPRISLFRQLLAFLWLLYMCAAALSPLPTVKVWGNRALVRRNTYAESACWYAAQTAKLTVPLTYNFLTFAPEKASGQTVFYRFLGRWIELTPLGVWFDYLFPMVILVPVGAAVFGLYGRVGRWLGGWGEGYFAEEEGEDGEGAALYGSGGWREGRALIERELLGRGGLEDGSTPLDRNARWGDSTANPPSNSTSNPNSIPRASRTAPSLYIPPAANTTAGSARTSNNPSPSRAQSQATRLSAATRAAQEREGFEEDDGPFAGFAHRVRNTLEGVEAPEWVQELGKRPKWMGGDGRGVEVGRGGSVGSGGSGGSGGGSGSGGERGSGAALSGLNRWFGRGGGAVRL